MELTDEGFMAIGTILEQHYDVQLSDVFAIVTAIEIALTTKPNTEN